MVYLSLSIDLVFFFFGLNLRHTDPSRGTGPRSEHTGYPAWL